MLKKTLSLMLALVLLAGLCLPISAADTDAPAVSDNRDTHFYRWRNWAQPIASHLTPENGGYLRVEHISGSVYAERYDSRFNFVSGWEIPLELPIYGGVYVDSDYNFVVSGQENPDELDTLEVIRITRYTKDWVRVDSASLYGANTYIPFEAGSLRFARSGDYLQIRTCHQMYKATDGYNHQANMSINLRVSDMTVTDYDYAVSSSNFGYSSHSFDQYVLVDGEDVLAADLGDAYPRAVVLWKGRLGAGTEQLPTRPWSARWRFCRSLVPSAPTTPMFLWAAWRHPPPTTW